MLIKLGKMLRGETDRIDFEYCTENPEDFEDIHFHDKTQVKGCVTNSAGYIKLSLAATVPFSTHCARCWKEIDSTLTLNISKGVAPEHTLQNNDTDDYLIIKNDELDLNEPLREAILLNFPMTFLCKEDCKGLCPKCGKDLNEGECACEKKEIDPRLEILKKMLDK